MNNIQPNDIPSQEPVSDLGRTSGILSIVFAIVGIFILGLIFSVLSFILSLVALWKRQFLLWGIGLFLAVIAAATSPSVYLAIGSLHIYNTESKKQEQIQKVAQEITATKKQESIPDSTKAEVSFSSIASKLWTDALGTPERSYSDTLKLATNMMQDGGSYLIEATPMDLGIIAYNPWMGPGIQRIHEQFARAIKENRTEIPKFPIMWNGPNLESITWKYQYTVTGAILSLKNIYLGVASSASEKFLATSETLNESEEGTVRQSLKALKEAIVALQTGTTPTYPIPVTLYGKNGQAKNSSITISKFPNGTFGIVTK